MERQWRKEVSEIPKKIVKRWIMKSITNNREDMMGIENT